MVIPFLKNKRYCLSGIVKSTSLALCLFMLLFVLLFTNSTYERNLTFKNYAKAIMPDSHQHKRLDTAHTSEIACFTSDEGNEIPVIDNDKIISDAIFFHETSCKGGLLPREACTVEQAAKNNPEKQVYVMFSGPVPKENLTYNSALGKLRELPNVHIGRIHLTQYAKGTPAESFLSDYTQLEKGPYAIYNAGIIGRLLSLYKHNGISLDLDVMTVKNLKSLPTNFVVLEKDNSIGTVAMAFRNNITMGTRYLDIAINHYVRRFNPFGWGTNGPVLMTSAAKALCKVEHLIEDDCNGLQIIPSSYFHNDTKQVHGAVVDMVGNISHPFYSQKNVNGKSVFVKSAYEDMVKKNCPIIYELFGERFIL